MSNKRMTGTKNPAHDRVFSFFGSGGAFIEKLDLYADPFPLVI